MKTLPTNLVFFKAIPKGHPLCFSWATGDENNVDVFEIQHSLDGSNFTTVKTVAPHKSATSGTYEVCLPYTCATMNGAYRIAERSIYGMFTYSQMV